MAELLGNSVLFSSVEVAPGHQGDCRVRAGRIVALAPRLRAAPGENVVDGRGGALLPGLADHHLHLTAMAAQAASVDLSGRTAPTLGRTIRAAAPVRTAGSEPLATTTPRTAHWTGRFSTPGPTGGQCASSTVRVPCGWSTPQHCNTSAPTRPPRHPGWSGTAPAVRRDGSGVWTAGCASASAPVRPPHRHRRPAGRLRDHSRHGRDPRFSRRARTGRCTAPRRAAPVRHVLGHAPTYTCQPPTAAARRPQAGGRRP